MAANDEATISLTASHHFETTPENSLKMTRYMRGVSVPGFASFLGSVGLVTCLYSFLDALNLLVLKPGQTADSLCDGEGNCLSPRLVRVYHIITAILGLLLNIGMLVFSFKLWKKVSDNNLVGMRFLIKIGCYIMAGLEILHCVFLIVYFGILISNAEDYIWIFYVLLFAVVIVICFAALLIVGVRMVKPVLVNANIIFKITSFILGTILAVIVAISMDEKQSLMSRVNTYLRSGWLIFYSTSFTVLHYNIMLHDQQGFQKLEMTE